VGSNVKLSGWRGPFLWALLVMALHMPFVQTRGSMPVPGPDTALVIRPGVAAGMGVSYVSMTDVVDLANGTIGNFQRIPEFKSAAEFFGALTIPWSEDWELKFEYAYLVASYNVATAIGSGQAEYTATAHLPSLIVQYVLMSEPVYNVKVGAGGGYHFGSLDAKFFTQDDHFTGRGPGFLVDVEGNTAFGESLFAYLGLNIRWDFIGELTNASGMTPTFVDAEGAAPTMQFFGIGARLGFTYYF